MKVLTILPAIALAMLSSIPCSRAADWRVTALDPTHLALQGDYTDDERAAFSLSDEDRKLTGWKFDNAFNAAATQALATRAERETALREGPFAIGGKPARHALWKSPNGLLRFPDGKGHEKASRNARLLYTVFLVLDEPLAPGKATQIALPSGAVLDFAYDPAVPSPLFKVNQVGYSIDAAKRYAYLGGWLGPLGPWPAPKDAAFELVDSASGKVALTGPSPRAATTPSARTPPSAARRPARWTSPPRPPAATSCASPASGAAWTSTSAAPASAPPSPST